MRNILLVGDSIFDNHSYVDDGHSVTDILQDAFKDDKVTLIAVDGAITTDVKSQLLNYPKDTSHLFISCGGNDALETAKVLVEEVNTVSEAFYTMKPKLDLFRSNYAAMLDGLLIYSSKVTVCTIYNKSPSVPDEALVALRLFNDIILEEVFKRQLPLIDLRVVFDEDDDYSQISPIEPSYQGGQKIAKRIKQVVDFHDFKLRNL